MSQLSYLATIDEVSAVFHKSKDTIRYGLQQGVFPWGYAVQEASGKWSYIINRRRFEQIEGIELGGEYDERKEN